MHYIQCYISTSNQFKNALRTSIKVMIDILFLTVRFHWMCSLHSQHISVKTVTGPWHAGQPRPQWAMLLEDAPSSWKPTDPNTNL